MVSDGVTVLVAEEGRVGEEEEAEEENKMKIDRLTVFLCAFEKTWHNLAEEQRERNHCRFAGELIVLPGSMRLSLGLSSTYLQFICMFSSQTFISS